jgi:hypothetical protein
VPGRAMIRCLWSIISAGSCHDPALMPLESLSTESWHESVLMSAA